MEVATRPRNIGNRDEKVKVALRRSLAHQSYVLRASAWSDGGTATRCAVASLTRGRLKMHCDIDIALLNDENLSGKISGLGLLCRRQVLNRGTNEEDIGEVVQFRLGDVRLLEDISMES